MPLSVDDLARLAEARGWTLDRERLRLLLPEVQRLLDAAVRLRELPLDPAVPPHQAPTPGADEVIALISTTFPRRRAGRRPASAPGRIGRRPAPLGHGEPVGRSPERSEGEAIPGGRAVTADDLGFASAADIASRVRAGELSARQVTEAFLSRIEAWQPRLNCFTQVLSDPALEQARTIDKALRAGRPVGPLAGVPVAIKDIVDVKDTATTAASHQRFHRQAESDAPLAARLRAAGAILIGKTNLHEFAYGVTNNSPHYGPVRNPWDPRRIPGGSSGGSAAAVAAGLCTGAVGTDTGGSIRIPASLCGVVGLKPTYGRVPVGGVVPLSWSLDHAGPLARTVRDAALFFAVMAGSDEPMRIGGALRGDGGLDGVRVGLPRVFFWERLDPEVAALAESAIAVLRDLGARTHDVEVPQASHAGAVAAVVMSAEATASHEARLRAHPEGYGPDVRTRLERGLFLSATDYLAGLQAQRLLQHAWEACFDRCDVLIMPATQVAASPIEEDEDAAPSASLAMSVQLTRFTNPFNVTGFPALCVPCGFVRAGLPVGLQIVARPGAEETVLRVGEAYERAAGWTARRPGI